jgi:hypothetical protein
MVNPEEAAAITVTDAAVTAIFLVLIFLVLYLTWHLKFGKSAQKVMSST